jgi:hypothetical protein
MMTDRRLNRRASDEGWFRAHWREFMAWSYGIVCLWDFMLAPIFFAWFSHYEHLTNPILWTPLTTSGGGLYHVAMGAIIGVSSYGKTQENVTSMNVASNFVPPSSTPPPPVPDPAPSAAPAASPPTPATMPVAPANVITYPINPSNTDQ